MSLITRQGKGSKLTIEEMDNNLDYLESLGVKEITLEDTTIKFERVDGSFLEVDTNNNILGVKRYVIGDEDNTYVYKGILNYDFGVSTNIIDLKYILSNSSGLIDIPVEYGRSYYISGYLLNLDNLINSEFTSALLSNSIYEPYAFESPFNLLDNSKSIIIIQPDDKIIINYKDTLNWLNTDGSIYRELDYKINSMTLQTDDKLIISSDFVENTITNSEMAFYSIDMDYFYDDYGLGWYVLYFYDDSIYEINGGPLKEGITYELIFDGVSYFAHFEEFYYVEFDFTGYRWFFVNDVQPELGVDELIIIYEELQPTYTPIFTRLNSDGSIDTSFDVGIGFNNSVNEIVVQSNGKILLGGYFSSYNGVSSNYIIRLNTDGSIDTSFVIGTGFNNSVNSIAIQDDGKILVGGQFSSYNGVTSNRIIRLNPDGSKDTSFDVGTGFNNSVNEIVVQSDGKILVGGQFSSYNGVTSNRIIRLNPDGSKDTSFDVGTGFNNYVSSIAVQSDGKILLGGYFTTYNGVSSNYIIRLNTDGSRDTSFVIGTGFSYHVNSIAVQSDGKILVGGSFTTYNGATSNRIIRLNTDGSINYYYPEFNIISSSQYNLIKNDNNNIGLQLTGINTSVIINFELIETSGKN